MENNIFEYIKPLKTPVLFLIFNRPYTTKVVFKAIRNAKPPRLYIAADGPRKDRNEEATIVKDVRDYVINNIDWPCELKTLFRDSNLGCGKAASEAVTWFFENEEMGIILEDDCVPSRSFFWFCEELLERYKEDETVMHIGGFNLDDSIANESCSYYFSKKPEMWGWATWRRAWKYYDFDMKGFLNFKESNMIKSIFKYQDVRRRIMNDFENFYEKKIDTWDYQWLYAILSHEGVAIIPNKNMVTNIGFDANATHTKDSKNIYADKKRFEITEILHPETISVDDEIYYKYFCKEFYGMSADRADKKVSVCITVYNKEKYIAQCIDSVISQDYKNIEIIIHDNASTDGSARVISRYLSDQRIKLYKEDINRGMHYSFKTALEKATGDWVVFLNSDDYWIDNTFISQAIVRTYTNNEISMVCGGYKILYEKDGGRY